MPTDTPSAWLTEETYDRARIELALLLVQRNTGSHRGHHDREQRSLRIRQLQELLSTAAVGHEPPDDGIAEPGMVLTVRYEAEDLTETFLMADHEEAAADLLPVYSARSPLGAALCGVTAGQQRAYPLPGGDTMTVTMVAAVPYRHWRRPRRSSGDAPPRRPCRTRRSPKRGQTDGPHAHRRRSDHDRRHPLTWSTR